MRNGRHSKRELGLAAIVYREALVDNGAEARTSDLGAVDHKLANDGPSLVVVCIIVARDNLLRVVNLAVGAGYAGAHLVSSHAGLRSSLRKEGVESTIAAAKKVSSHQI